MYFPGYMLGLFQHIRSQANEVLYKANEVLHKKARLKLRHRQFLFLRPSPFC
jgi:hypothetical protein